ncbi:MAG: ABC transporter permease [Mycobacteriales bacterium]
MSSVVETPSGETRQPVDPAASGGRRSGLSTLITTILSFVLAMVVGGVLIALSDARTRKAMGYFFDAPQDTFARGWHAASQAYWWLFKGAILDPSTLSKGSYSDVLNPISETIVYATPLIFTGLSVALAFRAGLFNIGAQGQLIGGAILAGWLGFAVNLPIVVHVIVCLVGGMVGGLAFGWVAGYLKARTGAHEVITTIMLNYVAINLLGYLLTKHFFQAPPYDVSQSRTIHSHAELPSLLGGGLRANVGVLVGVAAAVVVWWLLERTTIGFRLRASGANPAAARTAGMAVNRSAIVAMAAAGLLAGLAGAMQVLGPAHLVSTTVDGDAGFDGVTVALLGRGKPMGVVLAALFLGALRAGGLVMESRTPTSNDIITVTQALMVLFIAAPALIRAVFRIRAAGGLAQARAKGWNG